jgi:RNA binding exosome subunit
MHWAKSRIIGQEADNVSRSILAKLQSQSKVVIVTELEKCIDEHDSLYLRLDRQLLDQSLVLGSEEPIRIKFKLKNGFANREKTRELYRELLNT